MRVTELILDGFKSYPVRTSIAGWDSSFNAITGLYVFYAASRRGGDPPDVLPLTRSSTSPRRNGSGKSNILDSICFVLGITNLTTVRPI